MSRLRRQYFRHNPNIYYTKPNVGTSIKHLLTKWRRNLHVYRTPYSILGVFSYVHAMQGSIMPYNYTKIIIIHRCSKIRPPHTKTVCWYLQFFFSIRYSRIHTQCYQILCTFSGWYCSVMSNQHFFFPFPFSPEQMNKST